MTLQVLLCPCRPSSAAMLLRRMEEGRAWGRISKKKHFEEKEGLFRVDLFIPVRDNKLIGISQTLGDDSPCSMERLPKRGTV